MEAVRIAYLFIIFISANSVLGLARNLSNSTKFWENHSCYKAVSL